MGNSFSDGIPGQPGWIRPAIAIAVILVVGAGGHLFFVAPDASGVIWNQSADLSGDSNFEFTAENTGIQSCEFRLTIRLYAANDTVVAQKRLHGETIPGGAEKTFTTSMTNVPSAADSVVYRPRCTNGLVERILPG